MHGVQYIAILLLLHFRNVLPGNKQTHGYSYSYIIFRVLSLASTHSSDIASYIAAQ